MTLDNYVLGFIMAGGRGSRLKILTKDRVKPAVGFAGSLRIFDLVATNVINSNIPRTIVATQFLPHSLTNHINDSGYNTLDSKFEIAPPYENGIMIGFNGTADSVRKSMDRITSHEPETVLVLGGDHIYITKYGDMIQINKDTGAELTIMANPVPRDRAMDLGIMKIDEKGKVLEFAEKPKDSAILEDFKITREMREQLGITDPYLTHLASMGNYAFNTEKLKRIFEEYEGNDFGNDIIPAILKNQGHIQAHSYNGYWRDVGKIDDYFDSNIEIAQGKVNLDLTIPRLRSQMRYLPSPRIESGAIIEGGVLLSPGVVIKKGARVKNAVIGYQTIIEEDSVVENSILLGADRNVYYNNEQIKKNEMIIGKGAYLDNVILDKNVHIGAGARLVPWGSVNERIKNLESIGLVNYKENDDKTVKGDFYIEPSRNILVIGKQINQETPIIPEDYKR